MELQTAVRFLLAQINTEEGRVPALGPQTTEAVREVLGYVKYACKEQIQAGDRQRHSYEVLVATCLVGVMARAHYDPTDFTGMSKAAIALADTLLAQLALREKK